MEFTTPSLDSFQWAALRFPSHKLGLKTDPIILLLPRDPCAPPPLSVSLLLLDMKYRLLTKPSHLPSLNSWRKLETEGLCSLPGASCFAPEKLFCALSGLQPPASSTTFSVLLCWHWECFYLSASLLFFPSSVFLPPSSFFPSSSLPFLLSSTWCRCSAGMSWITPSLCAVAGTMPLPAKVSTG